MSADLHPNRRLVWGGTVALDLDLRGDGGGLTAEGYAVLAQRQAEAEEAAAKKDPTLLDSARFEAKVGEEGTLSSDVSTGRPTLLTRAECIRFAIPWNPTMVTVTLAWYVPCSRKTWQAKHVDEETLLGHLDRLAESPFPHVGGMPSRGHRWVSWPELADVMPEVPVKVLRAKLHSLVRRGVLDGCAGPCCDCRGDFERPWKARDL